MNQWLRLPGQHRHHSLRRWLLIALLPVIGLGLGIEVWFTYRNALDVANTAYDRSLLGAIRSIRANISTASGGLSVELPYRLFELFEMTANGDVFFRVATEDNLVEIGSHNLPTPQIKPTETGRPVFYDGEYFNEPVRLAFSIEALQQPLAGRINKVYIQVAESVRSREDFAKRFVWNALGRHAILVVLLIVLVYVAISLALRPLAYLRRQIENRPPADITPIMSVHLPRDLQPLIDTVNLHVARNRELGEQQRLFLDGASHQLRTPLATLRTQLDYALRNQNQIEIQEALRAMSTQLERAIRNTNQLLTLARSDATMLEMAPTDLCELARDVVCEFLPRSRKQQQDLGLETPNEPVCLSGHSELLREAVYNLIDNAIRYAPAHANITVFIKKENNQLRFEVFNNQIKDPSLTETTLSRLGTRFTRGSNTETGTGLGLAIVHSIVRRHQGTLELSLPQGGGFLATLQFTL